MTEVAAPPAESPYKGLARYEEADAAYFFGRDAEAELVVSNVLAARLTVLFGDSGVGKSSLLHAGVAPRLRARDDVMLVIFSDWRGDAAASLASALREESGLGDAAAGALLASTIAECSERSGRDLIIVLDQFEEYFVYHPDEDGRDRFALEFARAVTNAELTVSFLIAMREDALARLERFKGGIPGLFDNYLRLDRLSRDAAREAIVAPLALHAASHPDDTVMAEPALIEGVLDEVEVGRVALANTGAGMLDGADAPDTGAVRQIEAPYLQLVLRRLWNEERRLGSRTLRLVTLDSLGGAEQIVRTHLDVALAALSPEEQEVAAAVFRYLVTPSGTKIALRVDDLAEYAGQPSEAVARVLAGLAAGDTRVVRPASEDAYEIYHDVLAAAVLDWRARHLHALELAELERRRRRRFRLALVALLVAFAAGAAAGIAVWHTQTNRADAAERRARAQALELALALPYAKAIYTGHRAPLETVAISPDGARAVSADERGDVRIWATGGGREIHRLHADGELLETVFSPDGLLILAAGTKGKAIIWNWRTGKQIAELQEPFGLDGTSFNPSGQLVALAADDGTIRLWNWRTGRVAPILDGQGGVVREATFSPDGRLLVAGSDDGNARVWDWRSRRILAVLPTHGNTVYAVDFSPDGRFVATGGQDTRVRIWDWRTQRVVWSRRVGNYSVDSVTFSPDGAVVAAANGIGSSLWDWRRNRLIAVLREGADRWVTFSRSGCLVATAGYDRTARVWKPPVPGCPE